MLKYIMTDNGPIIFSDSFSHAEVAAALRVKPKTAGFVRFNSDDCFGCVGESISLGVRSDPEKDTERIARVIRGY